MPLIIRVYFKNFFSSDAQNMAEKASTGTRTCRAVLASTARLRAVPAYHIGGARHASNHILGHPFER